MPPSAAFGRDARGVPLPAVDTGAVVRGLGDALVEMAGISLGTGALTFCIGILVRRLLPIDV